MKKHNYRTKNVNEINWPELSQQLGGEAVTIAVDVAKVHQYALLTNSGQSLSVLVKWELFETKSLIHELKQLNCPVTVVMEDRHLWRRHAPPIQTSRICHLSGQRQTGA